MSKAALQAVYALNLSRAKEAVLEALAYHADEEGRRCYPSVATIATKAKYSERQVQRLLRTLEQEGFISVTSYGEGGRSRATEYALIFMQKGDTMSPIETVKGDILSQKGDMVSVKGDMVSPDISIKLNTKEDSKLFISLDGRDFEISYLVNEANFKHWYEANLQKGFVLSPLQWQTQQNTLLEIHSTTNEAISNLITTAVEKGWKTFFPIKTTVKQNKDFPRAAPQLQGAEAEAAWVAWLTFRHKTASEIFSSPRWKEIRDEEVPSELKEYAAEQSKAFWKKANEKTNLLTDESERRLEQEALQRKQQMLRDLEHYDTR